MRVINTREKAAMPIGRSVLRCGEIILSVVINDGLLSTTNWHYKRGVNWQCCRLVGNLTIRAAFMEFDVFEAIKRLLDEYLI